MCVCAGLPDLKKVVLFPFCGTKDIDISGIPNWSVSSGHQSNRLDHFSSCCSVFFDDFIRGHEGSEMKFEQVPFNHPLFVMYSSGTTGIPKCMVHSAGVSHSVMGEAVFTV